MKKLILLFLGLFILFVPSSYATNWCNDANMRGAWLFNEASGTLQDCTSNNNDGTASGGGTTVGVAGKYSLGVDFSGATDDQVGFGSAASLDDIGTISVGGWIAPDTVGNTAGGRCSYGVILGKDEWALCLENKKIRFYYRWDGGQNSWDTTADVVANWDSSWHHVAATYNGTSASNDAIIYFDGVAVATNDPSPCCSAINTDAGSNLRAGIGIGDVSEFDGKMDELFVYAGILNSSQISEIKDSGLQGDQGSAVTSTITSATIYNSVIY